MDPMESVTADRQPAPAEPRLGDGEPHAAPEPTEGTPPPGQAPEGPEVDTLLGESDLDSLAAFLGEQGRAAEPEEPPTETPDPSDDATQFSNRYDAMSDEELQEQVAGMSGKQIRAEFGNGAAMQRRFNRSLQEVDRKSRELDDMMARAREQLDQLSQAPASQAQTDPQVPTKRLTWADAFDEDGQFVQERADAMMEQLVENTLEKAKAFYTQQSQESQKQTRQQEFNREFEQAETAFMKAFPQYRDPDRRDRLYARMQKEPTPRDLFIIGAFLEDMVGVSETVLRGRQQDRQRAAKPATRAPVTPPGGTSPGKPAPNLEDPEARLDAMAADIAKLSPPRAG